MARPLSTSYSPEERQAIAQSIIERITQGQLVRESVEAEGISIPTFYKWTEQDAALAERYMRARSIAADALAEQAVSIARDTTPETAQADRLRYDALRWLAGKRRPKDYGDHKQVDVAHTVTVLPPDERDARLQALLSKASVTASAKLLPAHEIDSDGEGVGGASPE
jgi:hypothetical protein